MEHDQILKVDNLSIPEFVEEIRLTAEELRLRSKTLRDHSAHIRGLAEVTRTGAIVLPTINAPSPIEDQ